MLLNRESSLPSTTTVNDYCPESIASAEQANTYNRPSRLSKSVRLWPVSFSNRRDGRSSPHCALCLCFHGYIDTMAEVPWETVVDVLFVIVRL